MKKIKVQLHRLTIVQIGGILLLFGLLFGVLFANLFRDAYQEQMLHFQNTVFSDIALKDIHYYGLFIYTLKSNFKAFAAFWLLSITILGIPYMAYKVAGFGFATGFFISAVAMQYGFKGILLVLVYVFPHGLLYLPVALFSLYKGYELCKSFYLEQRNHTVGLAKFIRPYVFIILILAVVLLIGSFLEAYVGSFLLKKTLELFV